MSDIRVTLLALEADLDAGRYRTGAWEALGRVLRQQPRADRRALSADVSRLSQKLHARHGFRRLSVLAGICLEGTATAVAGGLLWVALDVRSDLAALIAVAIWITTFQPLLKVMSGWLVGIQYDEAYLRGVEPRFKMRYGTYLAAPRCARIAVHASGMVGSPMAAWLGASLVGPTLPLVQTVCLGAGVASALFNGLLFCIAVTGRRRVAALRLSITSGGVAGAELREMFF